MAPTVLLFLSFLCAVHAACDNALPRPDYHEKAKTARWMVHSIDYGVLSTLSSDGAPFGNVYSFVDGPCNDSTGTPYFFGTYMDQSFQDTLENPTISLTLTEASLPGEPQCYLTDSSIGDAENPVCARLTLTGQFSVIDTDSHEYVAIKQAFLERHPQMKYWPADHHWIVAKMEIQKLWLIDFFGGATILTVDEYYAASL